MRPGANGKVRHCARSSTHAAWQRGITRERPSVPVRQAGRALAARKEVRRRERRDRRDPTAWPRAAWFVRGLGRCGSPPRSLPRAPRSVEASCCLLSWGHG